MLEKKMEADDISSRSDTEAHYSYKNYLKLENLCPSQHL